MMQLKAIFSILLRRYEFELAQPADSYRTDHTKMVVQLQQPCRVRYRRRAQAAAAAGAHPEAGAARATAGTGMCVKVDLDLCQGHAVCVSEAPEVFAIDPATNRVRLLQENPDPALRAKVEAAVQYCPTRALSIQKEE
jgi:sterol 14-demethylase